MDDVDRIVEKESPKEKEDRFAADVLRKKDSTAKVLKAYKTFWVGWKQIGEDEHHVFLEWTGTGDPVRPGKR